MRNKLLLIEPYSVTPIDSGGKNRIYHTIKELSKQFDLNVLTIPTNKKDFFSYLKWGIPYWFSDWHNPEIAKSLAQRLEPTISIEFSQLLYLVDFLPKNSKKIFTAHDISTITFLRRLKTESNILKKILSIFRLLEIYLYEKKYLPKYDTVITVSDADAKELKSLFHLKNVIVIPNGIDKIEQLPPRPQDGKINLGFIGSATHPPNKQAIDFLINKIVPELESHNLNFHLYIAGNSSKSTNKNITFMGYIDNLKDFYQNIDMLVAPIFSGSGSRIKILESLSFDRQVLTTKIGAEGIGIKTPFLQLIEIKQEKNAFHWVNKIVERSQNMPSGDQAIELSNNLSDLTWENIFMSNINSY